ncbi:MAG: alpha/beta hydrolase-fold protein, partial [Bacteroidota bacterium]
AKEVLDSTETAIAGQLEYDFKSYDNANLNSGSLIRIDSFPSNYIEPRPVDVWLPQDYSEEKSYSVLYMHDGQMLFDSTTTWNKQEWKVDEWASSLMKANKTEDFIVVAIHNIPQLRWQDLFPQKAFENINEGVRDSIVKTAGESNFEMNFNGDNYLRFMVEELKPLIDSKYKTKPDKEHTFVMGSSMGGLMSMYAISEYPEVYGGAACLSTHWVGVIIPLANNPFPDAILEYVGNNLPQAGSHKLYFDYGNKTLDQYYPQFAPRVDEILKAKGYTETDSRNLFFENTDHSEISWSGRLDKPLLFLLGS